MYKSIMLQNFITITKLLSLLNVTIMLCNKFNFFYFIEKKISIQVCYDAQAAIIFCYK